MTGDKPFVAVMWLCAAAVLVGYVTGSQVLIALGGPVAVGTFVVWAWWEIKRRRRSRVK